MKKALLFVSLLVAGFSLSAQVLLTQDFSSGSMTTGGWMVFGNSSNWVVNQTTNAAGTLPEGRLKSTPAFNGNMRYISPAVDLTGKTQVIIRMKHMFDHADGSAAAFTLAIETRASGSSPWNRVYTNAATTDIDAETITVLVQNSDVGSATFQFCLYINGNSANMKDWFFDDITLLNPLNLDAAMSAIQVPALFTGTQAVKGKFDNLGATAINAVNVNWQIDNGDIHTDALTGLNVTTGTSYQFTCTDPISNVLGVHDLKLWVSAPNGVTPDDDPSNDLMIKSVSIPDHLVYRRPMYEEFTSSTCNPCASFNNSTFNPFIAQHGDEITLVKYQMNWPGSGDPYYTAEGGVRRAYYGVNAVPDLYVDGKVCATSSSAVNNAFSTSKSTMTYVEFSFMHEILGNNVHIVGDILPFANYSGYTMQVAVVERITTGNVATNGETEFHNVMMKMVPDANGTSVNLTGNVPYHFEFTQDMSSTNVEEMDDLRVAIFLQKDGSKEIVNSGYSGQTGAFINITPANGTVNVVPTDPITINFSQAVRMVGGAALTNSNVANVITFKETDATGASVPFTATINSAKTLITVTPSPALKWNQAYYLKIDTLENSMGMKTFATSTSFSTMNNTGVVPAQETSVKVYPNPAKDVVNIMTGTDQVVNKIEILNIQGKVVRSFENFDNSNLIEVNVNDLLQGVYFIRITANEKPVTQRLVISR